MFKEEYWRAVLFGDHVERRRGEGKMPFNENLKSEATAKQQECLMRLFAVCTALPAPDRSCYTLS